MAGDSVGELPHQSAELPQSPAPKDRPRRAPFHGRADVRLDGVQPPPDFGNLLGEIGRAAREIGDLVAEFSAVAHAVAHDVVDGHADKRAERGDGRRGGVELKARNRMPPNEPAIRTMHSATNMELSRRMPQRRPGGPGCPDLPRR